MLQVTAQAKRSQCAKDVVESILSKVVLLLKLNVQIVMKIILVVALNVFFIKQN
jgi:hypothetical protein